MPQSISLNSQNIYKIQIYGQLDDSSLGWFGEAQVQIETLTADDHMTTFSDVVMDQAGLVGLIRRLHGRGMVLLSVVVCKPGELTASSDAVQSQNKTIGKTK